MVSFRFVMETMSDMRGPGVDVGKMRAVFRGRCCGRNEEGVNL